jgi:hypothetical protein
VTTHIDTLIQDASEAIRNAFTLVIGEGLLIIMCWAHVRINIVKHLHLLDEDYREDAMNDIEVLQLACSKEVFEKAKVGMTIRLKLTKPPSAAKDVQINGKRRRGRPKQATKALLKD